MKVRSALRAQEALDQREQQLVADIDAFHRLLVLVYRHWRSAIEVDRLRGVCHAILLSRPPLLGSMRSARRMTAGSNTSLTRHGVAACGRIPMRVRALGWPHRRQVATTTATATWQVMQAARPTARLGPHRLPRDPSEQSGLWGGNE